MDRASSPTGSGPDTTVDDGAQLDATTDAGADGRGSDLMAQRDLVAAVIYYESTRELFGAAATPPRLGKYTLERILGCGAFGTVILGRTPDTEGEVAIKILRTN
ncbi:hypothetical protein [Nannocystis sp.]|uniref:hypothetical protein n=1 Tax=Nannocystis sp. TaxID=1962667 RepID=UPI0025E688A4|nr:hypothetical protein [Nannocystis sp.]MBK7829753.1 hypothetical protein [Nannocystis sp.]